MNPNFTLVLLVAVGCSIVAMGGNEAPLAAPDDLLLTLRVQGVDMRTKDAALLIAWENKGPGRTLYNPFLSDDLPLPVRIRFREEGREWQAWEGPLGLKSNNGVPVNAWCHVPTRGVVGGTVRFSSGLAAQKIGNIEVEVTPLKMLFVSRGKQPGVAGGDFEPGFSEALDEPVVIMVRLGDI